MISISFSVVYLQCVFAFLAGCAFVSAVENDDTPVFLLSLFFASVAFLAGGFA